MRKKVSPLLFVASLACFLLPFATISCGGQRLATVSGLQLATGTTVSEATNQAGGSRKQTIKAEPAAAVAATCALLGLALALAHVRPMLSAACGLISIIALFLLRAQLLDRVAIRGQGALQIDFGEGFLLSLLFLGAAVAWNAYLYISGGSPASFVQPAPTPVVSAQLENKPMALALIKCPACGRATREGAFCSACGEPLASAS